MNVKTNTLLDCGWNLFEFIGAFTLIISLAFIGYEVSLANKITQVETEWEMFNSYAS